MSTITFARSYGWDCAGKAVSEDVEPFVRLSLAFDCSLIVGGSGAFLFFCFAKEVTFAGRLAVALAFLRNDKPLFCGDSSDASPSFWADSCSEVAASA